MSVEELDASINRLVLVPENEPILPNVEYADILKNVIQKKVPGYRSSGPDSVSSRQLLEEYTPTNSQTITEFVTLVRTLPASVLRTAEILHKGRDDFLLDTFDRTKYENKTTGTKIHKLLSSLMPHAADICQEGSLAANFSAVKEKIKKSVVDEYANEQYLLYTACNIYKILSMYDIVIEVLEEAVLLNVGETNLHGYADAVVNYKNALCVLELKTFSDPKNLEQVVSKALLQSYLYSTGLREFYNQNFSIPIIIVTVCVPKGEYQVFYFSAKDAAGLFKDVVNIPFEEVKFFPEIEKWNKMRSESLRQVVVMDIEQQQKRQFTDEKTRQMIQNAVSHVADQETKRKIESRLLAEVSVFIALSTWLASEQSFGLEQLSFFSHFLDYRNERYSYTETSLRNAKVRSFCFLKLLNQKETNFHNIDYLCQKMTELKQKMFPSVEVAVITKACIKRFIN